MIEQGHSDYNHATARAEGKQTPCGAVKMFLVLERLIKLADFESLKKTLNLNPEYQILYSGIVWYICYSNACAHALNDQDYDLLFRYPNKTIRIFGKDDFFIKYTPAMYALFYPNGMINPDEYKQKTIKENTHKIWSYVMSKGHQNPPILTQTKIYLACRPQRTHASCVHTAGV